MCGITGFNWKDEKLLKRMMKSIKHRGPDDSGKHLDSNFSLGHNRLSIIDLSAKGRQPMYSNSGNVCIVFNGEIYNYKELKKELKGYKFKTKTDTEVILAGYEKYGLKIIEKLNGMFALAIYDIKKKKLVLARDRLGIKPLYYYFKDDKLLFGSEIKAILQCKDVKRVPNEAAIVEYLTFQNTLDDKTFFMDVKQLLPGRILEFDGDVKIKKYWDVSFRYKKRNEKKLKKDFLDAFKSSVKRNLIADVPVGTYLSGGYDSGSVTTIAASHVKKINTFTIKFDAGSEYDETKCSREVAKQVGANIYEKKVTAKDFLNNFETMVYHMDEPKVSMPVISQYHLANFVRKKVKVALTGHGGDELLAGYPVFKAKFYEKELKKNPIKALTIFPKVLFDKKRLNIGYYLFLQKLREELKHGIVVIYSEKEKEDLLTSEFLIRNSDFDANSCVEGVYTASKTPDEKLQELYLKTYLPALFVAEDKMTMSSSLEARVPMCDNEMIDFALSVPVEQKLKNGEMKYVLKESMRGVIPEVLYSQEKRGFPTPFGYWLDKKEVMKYVKDILLSKKCVERGIFRKSYIEKLLRKRDLLSQNKIWCLINIEMWYRKFID